MRRFVFADEAGDFEFSKKPNASKYFIVCALKADSCELGHDLLKLRRELLWDGVHIPDYFHASEDKQFVRDRVFQVLNSHEFEIYAQVLEKSKAQPKIRGTKHRFYQYAWFYLFKNTMPKIIQSANDQLMVTTASIGVKKGQADFSAAVVDVLQQTQRVDAGSWRTTFCSSASDPCLQAVDYCTWAIQRRWERSDARSYDLIKHKIKYEYETWRHSTQHHY
jgi:hypothetical protein